MANGIYFAMTTPNAVRVEYPSVFTPRHNNLSGKDEYEVTMLIPKTDAATVDAINKAFAKIVEGEKAGNGGAWKGVVPPRIPTPLHDGDAPKENGNSYGPECKGHYVMRVAADKAVMKYPIVVVDAARQEILDPTKIYSGCWCKVAFNCKSYDAGGKKGITAYLQGVQFIRDDEPIGGGAKTAESMFDAEEAPVAANPFTAGNPFIQ